MLHIYYGFGKGKTSTLNGSAIRAKGANFRVAIYRFLKGRVTHEDEQLKKLDIFVKKIHQGTKFVIEMNNEEKENLKSYLDIEMDKIVKQKNFYDFYCFDELLDLKEVGMLSEKEIINFVQNFTQNSEVLISGHYKLNKLFEIANLITFYNPEKHYYNIGINARKGIEF